MAEYKRAMAIADKVIGRLMERHPEIQLDPLEYATKRQAITQFALRLGVADLEDYYRKIDSGEHISIIDKHDDESERMKKEMLSMLLGN